MRSSGGNSGEHFQVMQGDMGSTFNVTYIEHGGIGLYSQHSDCKDCPIRCPRSSPASFCKFKAPQGYKEFWQTVFFLPRSLSTLPCRRAFQVQAFGNVKWGLRASVNEPQSGVPECEGFSKGTPGGKSEWLSIPWQLQPSSVLLLASFLASQGQHSVALTTLSSFLDEIFIEQLLSVRRGFWLLRSWTSSLRDKIDKHP